MTKFIIIPFILITTLSLSVHAQSTGGTITVRQAMPAVRVASVGGTFDGKLSVRQLITAGGIDLSPVEYAEITRFELSSGVNGIFQTFKGQGPLFSPSMINYLGRLTVGSKVYIENIEVLLADSITTYVNSVRITISKDSVIHRREIYPVVAEFADVTSGDFISKAELKKYKYLRLRSNSGEFTVTKFTLYSSLQEDTKLFSSSNAVTDKMYDLFSKLRRGERLVFDDITAKTVEGKRIAVPPLSFKIR